MFTTKKSLGQHFLHAPQILEDIVVAGKVTKGDSVLEIGPGEGALTQKLLATGAHVVAIEKDDRLIPILHKKFALEIASKQFELIHADVLDIKIPHLVKQPYKLVANIPYYITGQIIRMFLESDNQPESMTLLIQKEVAERITTKFDDKESLLSLSVKVFGDPTYVRTVGKGAFSPPPTVDSAVLHIQNISKERLLGIDSDFFFTILHAGFAHKRKQLLPNLSHLYSKEQLIKAFESSNIDQKARAEDIPLQTWVQLCKTLV